MKVKLKSRIKKNPNTFPLNKKHQPQAHLKANEAEKAKFGKHNFNTLFKLGQSLPNDEILGHINQKGKISISKKVPPSLRRQVKFHEQYEYKILQTKPK